MRYIFLTLLIPFILLSKETIEVKIDTKLNISDDFKSGLEEQLGKSGYNICVKNGCKNVNKQVEVNIVKKSKKVYRFKAIFIDTKNNKILSVKSLYFKSSLDDYEKLLQLGKDITKMLTENIKTVQTKVISKKKKEKKVASDIKNKTLERMERIQKNMNRINIMPKTVGGNTAEEERFYNSAIKDPHIINNFY